MTTNQPEKTVMFALPNQVSGKLACVAGTVAGRSYDLSAGTFTIGRLDEHDLHLPTEPGVSKLHSKIIAQGDRYLVVDCESRNGTLLNGSPVVQQTELFDGDEIRICGCVLRFSQRGGAPRKRKQSDPHPVQSPDEASTVAVPMVSMNGGLSGMFDAVEPPPAFDPPPAPTTQPTRPTFRPVLPDAPALDPLPLPAPSHGRSLAGWYAAGLATSLLLGGGASAALVMTAPAPVALTAPPPVTPPPVQVVKPPAPPPVVAVVPPAPPPVVAAPPVVVAAAEADVPVADAEEPEPKGHSSSRPSRLRQPRSTGSSNPPVVDDEGDEAGHTYVAAAVETARSETLTSRSGGRVKTAEVQDGARVSKGQVLVTFESGVDAAEIHTLQDRIASLENAEDDEAKRELRLARQKLTALDAGQKSQPIVAGQDGILSGFNAGPGYVIKPNEVVGKIGDGSVSHSARIKVARGQSVKKGDEAMLLLKGGATATGTVTSVSGVVVIIDTGSEPADAVQSVRLP